MVSVRQAAASDAGRPSGAVSSKSSVSVPSSQESKAQLLLSPSGREKPSPAGAVRYCCSTASGRSSGTEAGRAASAPIPDPPLPGDVIGLQPVFRGWGGEEPGGAAASSTASRRSLFYASGSSSSPEPKLGNVTVKHEPSPTVERTEIVPKFRPTISCTMERPSPAPPA